MSTTKALPTLNTLVDQTKKILVTGGSPVSLRPPVETLPANLELEVTKNLKRHLKERTGLKHFYKTGEPPAEAVTAAVTMVTKLADKGVRVEKALNLSWLTLYDMAMLLDDSVSMGFEENAKDLDVLKGTVKTVSGIFQLSRSNPKEGITNVRFLNSRMFATNLKPGRVDSLFKGVEFQGETMIGGALYTKILQRYDYTKATKPLIVVVITDGEIEGERQDFLKTVIKEYAKKVNEFTSDENGAHSICYQFASLGSQDSTNSIIQALDDDETLGDFVDHMDKESLRILTSKDEKDSEARWIAATKLLLGPISSYYDARELNGEDGLATTDDTGLAAAKHKAAAEEEHEFEGDAGDDGDDDDW
ncbi:hypothetical protein BJ508DRAFT_415742 [Ascobolus immersus RN42]|uniref:VWFA domain-containing protein n=1 Tax=Ascobolus immersus RN42 TaxID=1160509 RepID=A0A3N4I6K4_ASCIM|nr:hypothetical protein BJ508DRAFT_415742 [Ascobolus immersus RN42]